MRGLSEVLLTRTGSVVSNARPALWKVARRLRAGHDPANQFHHRIHAKESGNDGLSIPAS